MCPVTSGPVRSPAGSVPTYRHQLLTAPCTALQPPPGLSRLLHLHGGKLRLRTAEGVTRAAGCLCPFTGDSEGHEPAAEAPGAAVLVDRRQWRRILRPSCPKQTRPDTVDVQSTFRADSANRLLVAAVSRVLTSPARRKQTWTGCFWTCINTASRSALDRGKEESCPQASSTLHSPLLTLSLARVSRVCGSRPGATLAVTLVTTRLTPPGPGHHVNGRRPHCRPRGLTSSEDRKEARRSSQLSQTRVTSHHGYKLTQQLAHWILELNSYRAPWLPLFLSITLWSRPHVSASPRSRASRNRGRTARA